MKRKIGFASSEYCKQRTHDMAAGKLQPRPNDRKGWYKLHIVRNAAQCKICGDVIESNQVNDYVSCLCGAIAVDGGLTHISRTGKPDRLVELSEYEFEFTLDICFSDGTTPENALEKLHQTGIQEATEAEPGTGTPEHISVVFRKKTDSFIEAKNAIIERLSGAIPGIKYLPFTDEYLRQFSAD